MRLDEKKMRRAVEWRCLQLETTRKGLCEMYGIGMNTMDRAFHRKNMSLDSICKILKALNCEIMDIVLKEDVPPSLRSKRKRKKKEVKADGQ